MWLSGLLSSSIKKDVCFAISLFMLSSLKYFYLRLLTERKLLFEFVEFN